MKSPWGGQWYQNSDFKKATPISSRRAPIKAFLHLAVPLYLDC